MGYLVDGHWSLVTGRWSNVAMALLSIPPEDVMKNRVHNDRHHKQSQDREDVIRRSLDEQRDDNATFNPRTGEDPGLLELTEDPRERRLKRHTM
jgi:hypothetical protein